MAQRYADIPQPDMVRELHGREALLALGSHFGWRERHAKWLHALWVQQRERELSITQPAALDEVRPLALLEVEELDEGARWNRAMR
jgi:hypothetical protein